MNVPVGTYIFNITFFLKNTLKYAVSLPCIFFCFISEKGDGERQF